MQLHLQWLQSMSMCQPRSLRLRRLQLAQQQLHWLQTRQQLGML
jgi:hypothetical protein